MGGYERLCHQELRRALLAARGAGTRQQPQNVVRVVGGDTDPALMEELRRAREAADDAALALQRSQTAAQRDQTAMLEEIRQLREALARDGAAASVAKAEAEKWRAMYDAARNDAGRDDKARCDVDALRLAVAHAEDRHRRELMLLGTEHGNAYASLRRSLAAAERRVSDLEPALEASEVRCRSREDQYREERNARLDLEEQMARMRGDVERSAKDAKRAREEMAEAALEAQAEIARANSWAKWRLAIAAAVQQNRDKKNVVGGNWRLAAAESKFNNAVEDLTAEQTRAANLQDELEKAREELVVARAAAAATERSDLPGKVVALEAGEQPLTPGSQQLTCHPQGYNSTLFCFKGHGFLTTTFKWCTGTQPCLVCSSVSKRRLSRRTNARPYKSPRVHTNHSEAPLTRS